MDWLYHRTEGDTHTADWRLKLQKVMHTNAGVYRNEDLLAEGCSKISELSESIDENIRVTHVLSYQLTAVTTLCPKTIKKVSVKPYTTGCVWFYRYFTDTMFKNFMAPIL